MAKKLKFSRRVDLDRIVSRLYSSGVTQSCIIHTLVLLLLSFVVDMPPKKMSPIVISMSETKIAEDVDYTDLEQPLIELAQETEYQPDANNQAIDTTNSSNVGQDTDEIDVSSLLASIDMTEINSNDTLAEIKISDLQADLPVAKQKQTKTTARAANHQYTNRTSQPGLGNSNLGSSGNGTEERVTSDIDEMNKRLQHVGAQAGDVQISLSWNSTDDIDLHVLVLPMQSQINWVNKRGLCGGMLDIDMNAHAHMLSNRPVENVFWPNQQAPQAIYVVGVQNYMPWSRNLHTPVLVVVKARGKIIYSEKIIARYGEGVKEVFRFNFK